MTVTRRLSRGMVTAAAVVMLIGVAVIMAFMLAASGVFEVTVAQTSFNSCRARNMAESAVALGEEAVEQAVAEGSLQSLSSPPVTVDLKPPQVAEGCSGYLTFDATNTLGMPWSTDNRAGQAAESGANGQTVPAGCVQLIGVGQSGSSVVRISVVLNMPSFPYVVASSGTFTGAGVTIAREMVSPNCSPGVNAPGFLPGNLVSNSGLNPALCLISTKVTGNAQAPGAIHLDAASQVMGAVEIGAPPVALPYISPCYNPMNGCVQPFPAATGNVSLQGFVAASSGKCGQGVTVPGDLTLNNAVVYVHGDLVVGGALRGTGSIWTTGTLAVRGGAALTTNDMIALVAQGDLTLTSSRPCQPSNFVGLVYTGGNLHASNMHLYGNFVANGNGGSGAGNVIMSNVAAVAVNSTTPGLALAPAVSCCCCLGGCAAYRGTNGSPTPAASLAPTCANCPKVVFKFSFNQFVQPGDTPRVLLWLEY